jgi:hypothetical protein
MIQTIAIVIAALMSALYSGVSINKALKEKKHVLEEKKHQQPENIKPENIKISEAETEQVESKKNDSQEITNIKNQPKQIVIKEKINQNLPIITKTNRKNGVYLGFGISAVEMSVKENSSQTNDVSSENVSRQRYSATNSSAKIDLNSFNRSNGGYNLYMGYKLFMGNSFFVAPEIFGNFMFINGLHLNYGGKINLAWNIAEKVEVGAFVGMNKGKIIQTYDASYSSPIFGGFVNIFTSKQISVKLTGTYMPQTNMQIKGISGQTMKTNTSAVFGGLSLEFF